MKRLAASLLLTALSACSVAACASPTFKSDIATGPTPWTHTRFDDAPEDFSFAIVADLESGYRKGVFDVALAELKLLRPTFILTIGDMIDGGTEDTAELTRQWEEFDARLADSAPFFHIAGNHDLTNVTQRSVWAERYGPRYYSFVYGNVLFLALDTEDYPEAKMREIYQMRADFLTLRKTDPAAADKLPYRALKESRTGEIGPEQSAYFEKAIADTPNVRWTILLMHKPVYERAGDGGLARIEAALATRPYTLLNGDLHRYSYSQRPSAGGVKRDYIMLGTTGGERGFDGSAGAVDHFMWMRMGANGPSIANIRLDGVFDKTGAIPADGAKVCLDWGAAPCPVPPSR